MNNTPATARLVNVDWQPLQDRGYVVVPGFLTEDEIAAAAAAYRSSQRSETVYVSTQANPAEVAAIREKLAALLPDIRDATDLRTDKIQNSGYFFASASTQLSWHTDHKSFYFVQDHYHFLNFWIPLIKPQPDESGLGLVPMDTLAAEAPELFQAVYRRGAASIKNGALRFEQDGMFHSLPCDMALIDRLGDAPPLRPGDLIIARTDLLHSTQPGDTSRVAITFRGYFSGQPLDKHRFLRGSPEKHLRMLSESTGFKRLLACFWWRRADQITLADYDEFERRLAAGETWPRVIAVAGHWLFYPVLLPHRLRSFRRLTRGWVYAIIAMLQASAYYHAAVRDARRKQKAANAGQ